MHNSQFFRGEEIFFGDESDLSDFSDGADGFFAVATGGEPYFLWKE